MKHLITNDEIKSLLFKSEKLFDLINVSFRPEIPREEEEKIKAIEQLITAQLKINQDIDNKDFWRVVGGYYVYQYAPSILLIHDFAKRNNLSDEITFNLDADALIEFWATYFQKLYRAQNPEKIKPSIKEMFEKANKILKKKSMQ